MLQKYAPPDEDIPFAVPNDTNDFSLQIASDLHIEFLSTEQNKVERRNNLVDHRNKAKYLALIGDIGVVTKEHAVSLQDYSDFVNEQTKHYDKVILVAGNHEYYHSTIEDTNESIQAICDANPKLVYLHKDAAPYVF